MAITAAVGGGAWSVGATWVGGVAPTAADDVLLTVTSGNVQLDSAANACRSITCTGYTGTLTFGSGFNLAVGDASGGALLFVAGMTVTLSGGTLSFVSTSNNGGTGWSVTTGGKVLPAVTINGSGGKWVMQDAFSCGASTFSLTTGSFFTGGFSLTMGQMSSNNGNTRTLDLTNSSVTCSVGGISWNFRSSGGATVTTTGSTITMTGASTNFLHGDASGTAGTYASVVFTGSGANQIGGPAASGITVVNLSVTGTATKTDTFNFIAGGAIVTGTLTLGGNTTQGVNRLLVLSSTIGTQRTITLTGAAVVISGDVDFQDILFSGAPSWTNSGAKFVGDCGGNGALITANITVAATQTHTASAGGNWSDATKWTSRVPLPQDNVIVDVNTTGTLTADMPRLGKDLTFTGFAGTCTCSVTTVIFGSLALASGMTWTVASGQFSFSGRGTHTITSAGKSFSNQTNFNGPGGTYTFLDAAAMGTSEGTILSFQFGSLNTGGFSVTSARFVHTSAGTLTLGSTVWTLTNLAASTIWSGNVGVLMSAASSTIVIGTASANTRTFGGFNGTYGTFTYTVATSTGQLTITGDNTFDTINFSDASNARTLSMPTATSTTVRIFNVDGSAAGNMTVIGDVDSTTLQRFSSFLTVQSSDATGGPWYAGATPPSVDNGSNTGWIFASAPVSPPSGDRSINGIGSRQRSQRKERLFNRKIPYYSQHRGR